MPYPKVNGPIPTMSKQQAASFVAQTAIRAREPLSLEVRKAFSLTVRAPFCFSTMTKRDREQRYSIAEEIGWYGHIWDMLRAEGYIAEVDVSSLGTQVNVYLPGTTPDQIKAGDARGVIISQPEMFDAENPEWTIGHYPYGLGWDPEMNGDRIVSPFLRPGDAQPAEIVDAVKTQLHKAIPPR